MKFVVYRDQIIKFRFNYLSLDINEKIEEFSELKNYTSLHKALRILDDGHMARLAKKLEVSVDMLNATLAVLNKI